MSTNRVSSFSVKNEKLVLCEIIANLLFLFETLMPQNAENQFIEGGPSTTWEENFFYLI